MTKNSPIIGDLVEEYREAVLPARGRVRATVWFARQLASLVPAWMTGGILLGATFVVRYALDEFAPPADFHVRSAATTLLLVGILLATSVWASWRSASIARGARAGLRAAAVAAVINAAGTLCLLAIWHDSATMAAIRAGGGLGEALELPALLVVPGGLLGAAGGCVGAGLRRRRSA